LVAAVSQAEEDPLAEGLEKDADNRLWVRMMQSLNIQADEDESYATVFAPTDRVRISIFDCCLSPSQSLILPEGDVVVPTVASSQAAYNRHVKYGTGCRCTCEAAATNFTPHGYVLHAAAAAVLHNL
jgi:hypothetical protein